MDVDRIMFHLELPRMLKALAGAHFVAVDFELSGIQSKIVHRPRVVDQAYGNKQTLQQRYEEAKEAAERYQILQVGLTIVTEDAAHGIYTVRPYNLFLNPILEEKLDIERIFSYQSGAVEFLLSHGFCMEAPFVKGVPYLSREEEVAALECEKARSDRASIADIILRADEVEALKFVRRVRDEIRKWKDRKSSYPDYINIAPDGHSITQFTERGLNNYEKRLVHQLVRAEFPELVSISRPGFIQIISYDEKRETGVQSAKMAAFKEKLARQVGLRWVVEGMVGGNLDNLSPIMFSNDIDGNSKWIDIQALNRAHEKVKASLKDKRAVLVGHNLFMDLIYFYKCFFGQLPDDVEDFQSIIHNLFPLVIDTKYMATHKNSATNAKSGLEELDAAVSQMLVPVIRLHDEHTKYGAMMCAHEAGYDSLITAKILIRLSTKLEAAGQYTESEDDGWHTPSEGGGILVDHTNKVSSSISAEEQGLFQENQHRILENGEVSLETATGIHCSAMQIPKSSKKKKSKAVKKKSRTAFSHTGRFDLLEDLHTDGEGSNYGDLEDEYTEQSAVTDVTPMDDGEAPKRTPSKPLSSSDQPALRLMPRWNSDFWNVYGNLLRVNGTVEGVCDLTGRARK